MAAHGLSSELGSMVLFRFQPSVASLSRPICQNSSLGLFRLPEPIGLCVVQQEASATPATTATTATTATAVRMSQHMSMPVTLFHRQPQFHASATHPVPRIPKSPRSRRQLRPPFLCFQSPLACACVHVLVCACASARVRVFMHSRLYARVRACLHAELLDLAVWQAKQADSMSKMLQVLTGCG